MAASRGETKKEIAFALGITVRTVEYYWTQIFRKLRCTSQVAVMLMLFRCATDARDPGISARRATPRSALGPSGRGP